MQKSVALIKQGAVREGYTAHIIDRYLNAKLTIVRVHAFVFHPLQGACFYQEHLRKDYFASMIETLCSGTIIALLLEGHDAIAQVRALNGPSNEKGRIPGTIRYDFPAKGGVVHGSDSDEAAAREDYIVFPNRLL